MKRAGLANVRKRYGIHRRLITELVRGGVVQPQRGERREYRFSFQEVVLLRMAQDLIRCGIAPKTMSRFLKRLRDRMPAMPAAGVRLAMAGREIVFRDNGKLCNIDGQLILDFGEPPLPAASVIALERDAERVTGDGKLFKELSAEGFYAAALAQEQNDPWQAADYYRKAIGIAPDYAAAYANLACLLIEAAQYGQAHVVLRQGVARCPDNALLHFNLGIVLEETGKPARALARYRHAIALQPAFADAHYNAARLCERLGHTRAAVRHLNAYRRLERAT